MERVIVRRTGAQYTEVLDSLLAAIERRGLTVFAQIDHAAGAREVGLELGDELLVVFGNARGGTPLMQSDARVGIELPLKMLVWREGEQSMLGYSDPRDLLDSYDLGGREAVLEQMAQMLGELADEAAAVAQG
jgi:uncharacterized protein (DUF302 family)